MAKATSIHDVVPAQHDRLNSCDGLVLDRMLKQRIDADQACPIDTRGSQTPLAVVVFSLLISRVT
jgi:hypothetical protein